MKASPGPPLAAAGLFLALTYLFVRGDAPEAALHQRTLGALHAALLDDAALQRDALRARTGLLGNYDPLVAAVGGLRRATADLRAATASFAVGSAAADTAERHARLAAAVDAREALVEAFKSENALLRNSTRYFAHAVDRLTGLLAGAPDPVAVEVAALGNAMNRFAADPGTDGAARLDVSLDRVAGLPMPPPFRAELQALVPHGRLIASTLPVVDDLLARVLATPVAEHAEAFRQAYLEHHGRAEARAELSRLLLYLASMLLLAYLGRLFLRLRARLRFEGLIAAVAAEFVGLPPGATMDGIRRGLARLAGQLGADRAYAQLPGDDRDAGGRALRWLREGAGAVPPSGWPEAALAVCERRAGADGGRQRAVLVPRAAALPAGRDRAALEAMGVHAWLCVPMRRPGGERIGFLGFERARLGGRRWRDEDAALLSTAAEIFASALERERSAAEHEALEAELRRAQRMEAVGTLAGGIAHDFNNILGAIMGYAEMALEALPRGGRTREHLRQVWKAGERARGVIDQILAFSRRGDSERRPVWMKTVCEEAVDLLRASLPATVAIELHVEAAATEATVLGDLGRLQLVVVNLCTNAAQAMDGQGVVGICLGAFEPEREVALSHGPPLGPGRYVRLAVADTGHGIDAATAERVFEPFFTTKKARGGTGLGLATAHGVVADHGGALHLRSRPGEGSTFEVYLPRAEAPPAAAEGPATGAPVPRGRGEAVLLVDDERPLVLLGEEMLAALGYEPVGFDSASRALAAFRADPSRFDIVLTDEVMPVMTGTSLAAELRQIRPDLPVVLMTGHAGPVRADRLRASGICEVLRKPLASRTIAESLARHLRPEIAGGGDAAGGASLRAEA